ncbi:MAG: signal recognition particle protein [Bdellovibrionaceae bacterium]|nr:signal recognition particle protein [Pseudobdellovibrionaceae bacterium]
MSLLGDKLQGVFKTLRGYGKLSESNVSEALREVRLALLAADVNYKVAKDFCERVKEQALGQEVQGSIRPGDLFVKIVHDELIQIFGEGECGLLPRRPLRIALCGLNGAGKTTTAGKLAAYFKKDKEKVLLVAGDLTRPAAIQQLEILGKQIGVEVMAPQPGVSLSEHLRAAQLKAEQERYAITLFDLAGRTDINTELLAELKVSHGLIEPDETLLVADAAMGQAAVEIAEAFQKAMPLTGLVLSKFDGDARGGAAFSLHAVSGAPIKFIGTGERLDQLEPFQPERLVKRLLGMGDLYGLAQKVTEEINLEDAARMQEKLRTQSFDLQDFLDQMKQLKKLGPLQNLLGMMPGVSSMQNFSLDENVLKRTEAIISSMTKQERRRPEVLNARRRQRIAAGSGTSVTEVNQLLQRFQGMKKMMGKLTRGGNQENKLKKLLGGGGFPF